LEVGTKKRIGGDCAAFGIMVAVMLCRAPGRRRAAATIVAVAPC
jgi:hypothetical protein